MSKKPAHQPWMPAPYDPDGADTMAIKALATGTANEGQQRRALKWIIEAACGTYDLSFRPGPDGERETAFAEGKRHIGLQLVKHINGPMPTTKPVK
jgi:hypothetical protein